MRFSVLAALLLGAAVFARAAAADEWRFAVSGDSRNCGDVVMPTIAKDAGAHDIRFYWHLGDFRWGSHAKTHVYGYLLGTVAGDGSIKFDFKQLEKGDVPKPVARRYGKEFIGFCFDQNAS